MLLVGADVSQWQDPLGPNDLDFFIPKASQGFGYRDPHFLAHMNNPNMQGKIPLAYHFGEYGEGAAGAQNFIAAITPVVNRLAGVAYDCEFQNPAQTVGPAYADAVAWNQTVAARWPRLPRYLYTGAFYWVGHIGNPPPLPGTRLWWAHLNQDYNDLDPHRVANATTKPPYPDLSYPDYAIRQVGWNASIGGQHPVDVNISYLTRQQLAGGAAPTPSPGGDIDVSSLPVLDFTQRGKKVLSMRNRDVRKVLGLLWAIYPQTDQSLVDQPNIDYAEHEVRSFQRQHGLASDGICGGLTWQKLVTA